MYLICKESMYYASVESIYYFCVESMYSVCVEYMYCFFKNSVMVMDQTSVLRRVKKVDVSPTFIENIFRSGLTVLCLCTVNVLCLCTVNVLCLCTVNVLCLRKIVSNRCSMFGYSLYTFHVLNLCTMFVRVFVFCLCRVYVLCLWGKYRTWWKFGSKWYLWCLSDSWCRKQVRNIFNFF